MAGDKHFYIESFDTLRLSSFRVGQSPFAPRYVTDQTIFGVYCNRLYPLKGTRPPGQGSRLRALRPAPAGR